jgi:16S rRNA (adenine1518-N6/adenine1519-N6)-dimethyltransferase
VSDFQPQNLPSLSDVIKTHDLRAKKALGQNFIMDPAITGRIAFAANITADQTVIEVGPGPGGLTRSLLSTPAKKVVAIEYDTRAVGAMRDLQQHAGDRLIVMEQDALHLDWEVLLAEHQPAVIVANLPYNIATALLVVWLKLIAEQPTLLSAMTLMFQKEVAERLTASPHSRDYGRLSVLTQWLCQSDYLFTLPPGAFVPPPKVYSSVVRLQPRARSDKNLPWSVLDDLLQRAFAQRRKMLRGTIKDLVPVLEELGLQPTERAEDIAVDDYLRIAQKIRDAS